VFTAISLVALGTVLIRRSRTPMPVPALTGWSMVVGATLQLGGGLALGESVASIRVTPLAVATVLYLGVFAGAIGLVGYLVLVNDIGPVKANLVTYLTPIVSLTIGWAFLDERITLPTLVGFAVIVAGFVLLESRAIAAELAAYRGTFR